MRRVSEDDKPKKGTPPPPGFLDDSIVREARESIGKMLGTAIEALGKDIEKVLQTNVSTQTEVGNAVAQITTEMIQLLADRVRGLMPGAAASPPPDGAGGSGAAKPAAPQSPTRPAQK